MDVGEWDWFLSRILLLFCCRPDSPQYGGTVEVQTSTGAVVSAHKGEGSDTILCTDVWDN